MLSTPMKGMKPATGKTMPAGPVAKPVKKPMMPKLNAALAAKQAGQTPQIGFKGAAGGSLPGQSVLGGARLLPQRQAGSVRANAARGMQEMQAKQAAMREAQMQQEGEMGPPMMEDRMARPPMMDQGAGEIGPQGLGDPRMQQMQQMMQKRKMMEAMMQQQQGRGMPQNMGEIQSLVPPGMGQFQPPGLGMAQGQPMGQINGGGLPPGAEPPVGSMGVDPRIAQARNMQGGFRGFPGFGGG